MKDTLVILKKLLLEVESIYIKRGYGASEYLTDFKRQEKRHITQDEEFCVFKAYTDACTHSAAKALMIIQDKIDTIELDLIQVENKNEGS
jgi:hypothetical protein